MATKIRLQRFGKKGRPFYHVVVADSRAPRDGKFIERLGSYDPNTHPATIELNIDSALNWLNKGAQPTETCRSLLSTKGVLYKKHLEGGVKKGAFSTEQAEAKFNAWAKDKEARLTATQENVLKEKDQIKKTALARETKKKEEIAAAILAKKAPQEEVQAPEESESPSSTEGKEAVE